MSAPARPQPRPKCSKPSHETGRRRASLPRPGETRRCRLAALLQAEQRGSWLRGQRVTVEVYFDKYPTLAADAEAALDVIYAEYALRQELGEAPGTDVNIFSVSLNVPASRWSDSVPARPGSC